MRLLIITQKMDKSDPVLGFFYGWVNELAKKVETIEVICLEKGEFNLPKNVTVYSLGKEEHFSKIVYIRNFYRYLRVISGSYDKVFVHMNQEYILLAGLYWNIKRIPIYFWRNHPNGNFLTRVAVSLSTKIFCTSKSSFTARFYKTVLMPAGIDTNFFKPKDGVVRKKYSVCMVGRIAQIKHIDVAIEAINLLTKNGTQVTLDIIGSSVSEKSYEESLKNYVKKNNLSSIIHFSEAVKPEILPEIYSSHELCLNLTDVGSFDKTIVEAASCGTIPVISNDSLKDMLPLVCLTSNFAESIAGSIKRLLDPSEQIKIQKDLENFVHSQSLNNLVDKLLLELA